VDEGLDAGCRRGGSLKLRELIEEHPAELAYDFRSRFGLSSDEIGHTVTLREAVMLTSVLLRDPSSWTQAAQARWDYPVSREWIVATHSYDLLAMVNSGKGNKPKPYPNPFPQKDVTRIGKTTRSPEEVRRLLAKMNPKEPS